MAVKVLFQLLHISTTRYKIVKSTTYRSNLRLRIAHLPKLAGINGVRLFKYVLPQTKLDSSSNLKIFITCNIQSSDGIIHFNITSEYDFVPPTAAGFPTWNPTIYTTQNGLFKFITRDQKLKSSLWWGESLL